MKIAEEVQKVVAQAIYQAHWESLGLSEPAPPGGMRLLEDQQPGVRTHYHKLARAAVKAYLDHMQVGDDPPRCKWCQTPIRASQHAMYGVIGTDGSLCCDIRVDACKACEQGEPHPHEARDNEEVTHG